QRRCRAAAAGAVLKPQGGNCAVLPYIPDGSNKHRHGIEQIENQPPASGIFPCPAAGFGLFCFILPG
ncbi:hypothetical protein, partial [uncultured Gemmiger sp.]|uniref:hypothetical protein n=1 Tax=uncultured Gemmiger sp. TaxID=1623490 RepID=UPI0025DA368C